MGLIIFIGILVTTIIVAGLLYFPAMAIRRWLDRMDHRRHR